jgi:hypothetical protein
MVILPFFRLDFPGLRTDAALSVLHPELSSARASLHPKMRKGGTCLGTLARRWCVVKISCAVVMGSAKQGRGMARCRGPSPPLRFGSG